MEPLYNEVLCIAKDFLYRSNSKIYGKEPWDNLILGPSLYQGSTVTGRVYSTEADQKVRFTRSQLDTAISRKVVGKMCRRQSRKIIWDTINHCSWHWSCRTYFCYLPLALANIYPWPLVPFSQISLKNSELKTGQNSFRDCRLHFFRQPFSKYLYQFCCKLMKLTRAVSLIHDSQIMPSW